MLRSNPFHAAGVLSILSLTLSACSQPAAPPAEAPAAAPAFKPVASIKEVMKSIVEPASNAVFAAAGEAPKDDAGWLAVQNQALALLESGNLLLIPGRAVDNGEWVKQVQGLMDKANMAVEAARNKDAAKLGETGDIVYTSCEECHKLYLKPPAPPTK